jgi:pSer/pThr/pTyr-binding forkhead associated (FHA) protein
MDELIYVEVLGRHGEVAARHALRGLPIRIGRAYDGDVVLDDPCVAAHHAVVARSEAGDLEIADAGSRNGLFRLGAKRRLARERVDPGARYRVGRTVFRIRTANHPVAPELVERAAARWDRAIAWVAVLAATAAVLLCVWSETHERVEWLKLLAAPVFVLLAILGWSGAWGLAGRLLVGEARFAGHLAMGALTVLGCLAVANWDYLAFAFSAPGLRYVVAPATAAVVAWGLWRHLSLATRRPGRGGAVAAIALGAVAAASPALLSSVLEGNPFLVNTPYLKAIKTPAVRVASGREAGEFFREAGRLAIQLEALKRE